MKNAIPFIDLAAQREKIREKLESSIAAVIEGGRYILGPEVQELETRLRDFAGSDHCMTCANGTDALVLPLLAWGIGRGDAVFVPSFTFASTPEVVAWVGATPVFVDVDPETYCMDPSSLAAAIEQTVSEGTLRPRAVIAVDLFGQPADYPAISELTRKSGLKLIADSAQGFGCTLNGEPPMHWADVATTSFYPAKPLGCYGDGGAIFWNDPDLVEPLRSLSLHGQGAQSYEFTRIGMNSRLDTIQAAILLAKLDVFPDEIRDRNLAADRYARELASCAKVPAVIDNGKSVWAQYTIEVEDRDAFRAGLQELGVPTAVYYANPLHAQPAYEKFPVAPGGLPVTDAIAHRVVSLPMDGYMTDERQEAIIGAVKRVLGAN